MQAIKKGAFPPKRKDAVVLPQYCTGNRGACQAGAVRGPGPWPDGARARAGTRGRAGRENPSVPGRGGKTPIRSLRSLTGVFKSELTGPGAVEWPKIPERPLWRDFIAQRGHAPRSALCGGVLSPRGGSHPAPWSRLPGGIALGCPPPGLRCHLALGLLLPTPCPLP